MDASTVYWIVKLDSIRDFLSGFAFLTGAMFVCLLFFLVVAACDWRLESDEKNSLYCTIRTHVLCLSVAFPLLCAAWTFCPSTREMAAIIVVPRMVSATLANKTMQLLPEKLLTLADEWVSELSPKTVTEEK